MRILDVSIGQNGMALVVGIHKSLKMLSRYMSFKNFFTEWQNFKYHLILFFPEIKRFKEMWKLSDQTILTMAGIQIMRLMILLFGKVTILFKNFLQYPAFIRQNNNGNIFVWHNQAEYRFVTTSNILYPIVSCGV